MTCSGYSFVELGLQLAGQIIFRSSNTSSAIAVLVAVRRAFRLVGPIPARDPFCLPEKHRARFVNTSRMSIELVRCFRVSKDSQHGAALKETAIPVSCRSDQRCSGGQYLAGDKILWHPARIGCQCSPEPRGRSI